MIEQVAVVGSGYMGGGIAQVLALAGREVRLADVSAELAARSRERIIAEAAEYAGRGLFPEDAAERIARRVVAAASIEDAVRRRRLHRGGRAGGSRPQARDAGADQRRGAADALIGSNTSTISIGTLAEAVARAGAIPRRALQQPGAVHPGCRGHPARGTTRTVAAAR